jgi:NCS1 family nucleobase:cation symporter-1
VAHPLVIPACCCCCCCCHTGLILATLTTNIAANVVAPANAIVNLAPTAVTFTAGGVITAVLSILIMPWKLMSSSSGFVNWLVAYSALLGPVVGVVMADYFIVRGRQLDLDQLYSAAPSGIYYYEVISGIVTSVEDPQVIRCMQHNFLCNHLLHAC